MVEVLLVSNKNKDDVDKIIDIIYNLGNEFFIQSNITVVDEENADNINFDYDFAVTLNDKIHLSKKTINVKPIILDISSEKTQKDIQNQLLKAKATHKRLKESEKNI